MRLGLESRFGAMVWARKLSNLASECPEIKQRKTGVQESRPEPISNAAKFFCMVWCLMDDLLEKSEDLFVIVCITMTTSLKELQPREMTSSGPSSSARSRVAAVRDSRPAVDLQRHGTRRRPLWVAITGQGSSTWNAPRLKLVSPMQSRRPRVNGLKVEPQPRSEHIPIQRITNGVGRQGVAKSIFLASA